MVQWSRRKPLDLCSADLLTPGCVDFGYLAFKYRDDAHTNTKRLMGLMIYA